MGFVFILAALGLSIILGQVGVVNFAHGSFYAWGAYIAYWITSMGGNAGVALLASAALTGMVGAVVLFGIIRHLRDRHPLQPMVALVGLAFIFREVIRRIWGASPKSLSYPALSFSVKFDFLGTSVSYSGYYIVVMAISIFLVALFYYLFHKTDLGIRSLASIQDEETASMLGVSIDKVSITIIAISCAVAGIGGALAGPIFLVTPTMGLELIAFFFAVVIVGGLGSIEGTIIAGLTLGLVRSVPTVWMQPVYARILVFLVFIGIIIARPRGLRGLERVLE